MLCILYTLLPIHIPSFMRQTLIIFKLSLDPEFNKQLNRRTVRERKQNAVHIVHIATYSRIKFHAHSFISFKVIQGSRFLADWRTDERTDGKPIVPSGVHTGRGLQIELMLYWTRMSQELRSSGKTPQIMSFIPGIFPNDVLMPCIRIKWLRVRFLTAYLNSDTETWNSVLLRNPIWWKILIAFSNFFS